MTRLAVLNVTALLCLAPVTAHAQIPVTVITGTVLDAEGNPLVVADVHVERSGYGSPIARSRVERDGKFAIATAATGPVWLRFTAVDHSNVGMPLILHPPATVGLDVRLKRYAYTDSLDQVQAIGDWSGFSFSPTARRSLVKQADGRYTLDVETTADTVAYQLLGLAMEGRSINGTHSVRYVYDEGGDYRSVLQADHGHATIVFDPKRLDRRPGAERVAFRDSTSATARLVGAARVSSSWMNAYWDALRAANRAGRGDSLHYDWTTTIQGVTERLGRERDPLIRQLYLYTALLVWDNQGPVDTALVRRAVREIPAGSPLWSFAYAGGPRLVTVAAARLEHPSLSDRELLQDSTVARQVLPYLEQVIARQPDPDARAEAMALAIDYLKSLNQDRRAGEYYASFLSDYPSSWRVPYLKARYAPDRALRAGAQIPDFTLRALDDTTVVYSRASMMGQPYLLAFWATWCGPCTDEMPGMHAAYDSVSRRGIQFLSVSFDASPEAVTKFRADKWKMPWLHAYSPGFFDSPTARQLEIVFLPRAALVAADGTILATDNELAGERLLPALEQALVRR
jgi:thiol-disulfide isomerase/thioredoxin